jgi:hypothetical protein
MEESYARSCFSRTAQWDLFDPLHLKKKFIATTTHGSIRPSAQRMLSTPGAEQHKGRAEWRGSGYCSIPMQATLSSSVGACDYPGWS